MAGSDGASPVPEGLTPVPVPAGGPSGWAALGLVALVGIALVGSALVWQTGGGGPGSEAALGLPTGTATAMPSASSTATPLVTPSPTAPLPPPGTPPPRVAVSLGPVATCPPGSNPDEPGPVDQARPVGWMNMAFDRRAGRLVVVVVGVTELVETWTFDVCTNTWTQMHPDRELPDFAGQLVYDVDSDATIGIVPGWDGSPPGRVWAYDLQANTWSEKGVAPSQVALGAYDPISGLVVAANTLVDAIDLWTYDVETDTWTQIRQANGPPCGYWASAYDASVDRWVTYRGTGWGKEKAMCLIDIRTGTWSGTRAVTPPDFNTGFYALVPSVVYDETRERTVFSDGRRLAAYDATTDRWELLARAVPGVGSPFPVPLLIVYDPLHRRLVGVGWDWGPDVAFDPVTREWTVLLGREEQ